LRAPSGRCTTICRSVQCVISTAVEGMRRTVPPSVNTNALARPGSPKPAPVIVSKPPANAPTVAPPSVVGCADAAVATIRNPMTKTKTRIRSTYAFPGRGVRVGEHRPRCVLSVWVTLDPDHVGRVRLSRARVHVSTGEYRKNKASSKTTTYTYSIRLGSRRRFPGTAQTRAPLITSSRCKEAFLFAPRDSHGQSPFGTF